MDGLFNAEAFQNQKVSVRLEPDEKGHCLFTREEVKCGEVIFEEAPLIACQLSWNRIHKFLACDNCLSPLQTAEDSARHLGHDNSITLPYKECCTVAPASHVPCPQCQIMYCSEECRAVAEQSYHRSICQGESRLNPDHPINILDNVWRELTGPVEDQSILLLVRLMALIKQSENKAEIISRIKSFCSGTTADQHEHKLMKMVGPQYKERLQVLRDLFTKCAYSEELCEWFTEAGFLTLLSLIGRNGQGIGTSSISVWATNCDELQLADDEKVSLSTFIDELYEKLASEVGNLLNCEGVGLYSLQSLCNHSCCSNAEIRFEHNNSKLTLRALTDIPEGEEITINYLSECDRDRSRHSRHKILREMYLFTCCCARCVSEGDDDDVTSSSDSVDDDVEQDGDDMTS